MSKRKGSRAERELFHMLWDLNWAVVRSAGSGSSQMPSPDLIASNGKRSLAIECKSIKATKQYFEHGEIQQLRAFSDTFGAEPWVGVRFDNEGWYFVHLDNVPHTKGASFGISLDFAIRNGLKFEELIGQYKQERL